MAVSTLLVSPAAEGLFHRAIIASGITGHSTQSAESASGLASEFAAVLGVPATRAGLNRVSPDDVVSAQDELAGTVDLIGWLRAPGSGTMPWLPTVDGDLVVSPLFEGVAAGRGATVPVLTGTTLHEFRWMGIRAVPGPEGKVLGQRLADTLFRRPTEEFVVARAGAPAPTFRYEFQWEVPCRSRGHRVRALDRHPVLLRHARRTLCRALHGAGAPAAPRDRHAPGVRRLRRIGAAGLARVRYGGRVRHGVR
ncbi:MAG: carboxylesterase family protein [Galbitalea sp.]